MEPELLNAVAQSQQQGRITAELASVVHRLCKERCQRGLVDDIAQMVLMGLVKYLSKIDLADNVMGYVGNAIQKAFLYIMRQKHKERIYLLWRLEQELKNVPWPQREKARCGARAAFNLKYY